MFCVLCFVLFFFEIWGYGASIFCGLFFVQSAQNKSKHTSAQNKSIGHKTASKQQKTHKKKKKKKYDTKTKYFEKKKYVL